MKKFISLLSLLYMVVVSVNAQNAIVAPVVCYDENTQKLELEENPGEALFAKLEKYWLEGLVGFRQATENEYGMVNSAVDAQRICNIMGEQYIIYGFIQRNENSWYGDLKLYDGEKRRIIDEFFAVDNINRYDRFIGTLADRILDGFEDLLGLTQKQFIEAKKRPLEFRIPFSGFYWTPLGEKWSETYMGKYGGNVGIEIFPPLKDNTLKSLRYDFSGQIRGSYSCGQNVEDVYPFELKKFSISLPLLTHLYFSAYNSIYIGGGVSYTYETLEITEKYEEPKVLSQTFMTALGIFGYELSICKWVKVFTDVEFDFHISDDKYIEVRPTLGFSVSLYRGRQYEN